MNYCLGGRLPECSSPSDVSAKLEVKVTGCMRGVIYYPATISLAGGRVTESVSEIRRHRGHGQRGRLRVKIDVGGGRAAVIYGIDQRYDCIPRRICRTSSISPTSWAAVHPALMHLTSFTLSIPTNAWLASVFALFARVLLEIFQFCAAPHAHRPARHRGPLRVLPRRRVAHGRRRPPQGPRGARNRRAGDPAQRRGELVAERVRAKYDGPDVPEQFLVVRT
ncbi:hypothetical protein C8R44DRAFT_848260 [Mycena epipterygia]|nr:hypothetical protein C8R44DRAFT_848260 [Mycena epipterygia]